MEISVAVTCWSLAQQGVGKWQWIFQVGWLRASDQTILSVHTRTVTHNARIAVSYETGGSSGSGAVSGSAFGVTGSSQTTEEVVNGTWRLHIRQLKESDRDCYMCQINTSPMISELGCLDILGENTPFTNYNLRVRCGAGCLGWTGSPEYAYGLFTAVCKNFSRENLTISNGRYNWVERIFFEGNFFVRFRGHSNFSKPALSFRFDILIGHKIQIQRA